MPTRCAWVTDDPLYVAYHDDEWGVPVHDDAKHFEFLVLESAQSGLSWITILRKREGYRRAFAGFDPEKVARFGARDVERLLADTGIVRNRRKVESVITNARAFLEVQASVGSFDEFLWSFVGGHTLDARRKQLADVPAKTEESTRAAKEMKARGFKMVGPIVVYSHMQACGLVNDHTTDCFRHRAVRG